MTKILPFLFFLSISTLFAQNLQNPDQFFGEPKGTKFQFHSDLISYYQYLVSQKPQNVKRIYLGETNEGRPQIILAISSSENIRNLDQIKNQNIVNIGMAAGQINHKIPVIAMLSYNVHGNEAVSANAAPFVAFDLLNNNSEETLKDLIVLIDPCVNPDGYDRYAQWYNRIQSTNTELNAGSMEHNEPWPGGRFNHYLFDLNRDVAWQVQKESQQRIKFYNSWMPHLHADFHEMGPNSTYYFPPSAKPFHEDITPYQREFQEKWGQFNKKQFDSKGWLYYTKEDYDLLYPSYADTYPTYNGAMGATFEQGGSGAAGKAFLRNDGDTLTLFDRIEHTIANSKSTLAAISDQSSKTIEHFNRFFQDPIKNGYGKYKTFLIKNHPNIVFLSKQLDKLDIKYSFFEKNQHISAYQFSSKKESNVAFEENDLLINTFQPKGILTKILFEPTTMVEDSNTYDITSWNLALSYDLDIYGVAQKLVGSPTPRLIAKSSDLVPDNIYAYAINPISFQSSKSLASLLKQKVKIRIHEKGFETNDAKFLPGTVLITKRGNEALDLAGLMKKIENDFQIKPVALASGMVKNGPDLGSNSVDFISAPNVALLMGAGISPTSAGEYWHYMEQQLGYPVSIVDLQTFARVNKSKFDVIIMPSGNYSTVIKETKELADWVSAGGRLILIEEANALLMGKEGFGLKSPETKPEQKPDAKYENRERSGISDQIPGAIFKIKLDNSHPLAYGYGKESHIMLKNVIKGDKLEQGWNVGVLDTHVSGFVGSNVKSKLKNKPVFSVEDKGKGRIIYLQESPLFRGFWHTGKQLMANAIFLVK